MRVVRAQELFRQTELLGRVNPEHNISDHSMLVWDFHLSVDEYTDGGELGIDFPSVLITKYDIHVCSYPCSFRRHGMLNFLYCINILVQR